MKVAIIGASLGGLFAAYHLAQGGMEVEIYERSFNLGNPPRTLIVTTKLIDVLGYVPEEAILNRVSRFKIFSRSRSINLKLLNPDLVIERKKLVKLLANQATDAGAKIYEGYQFEGFIRVGKKIVSTLRNRETGEYLSIASDILIGADGVSSVVARTISYDGHISTNLFQAKVVYSEKGNSDVCQIWFNKDYTKYFFWSIPESEKIATVGLIADDWNQAREGLKTFLRERNLKPLEFQEAHVPLPRFNWIKRKKGWDNRIFLIGDAAAHVKATTVGGVVTGLYGAKALAKALLGGGNYYKELRGLRYELDLHLIIRNVLNRFQNDDYDELLQRFDKRLRDLLKKWTRDELRSFFFKMILREPHLLRLGMKSLLRAIID